LWYYVNTYDDFTFNDFTHNDFNYNDNTYIFDKVGIPFDYITYDWFHLQMTLIIKVSETIYVMLQLLLWAKSLKKSLNKYGHSVSFGITHPEPLFSKEISLFSTVVTYKCKLFMKKP